jgi:hypothetical protein
MVTGCALDTVSMADPGQTDELFLAKSPICR